VAAEAQGLLRGGRPCFYLIIYIEARAPRPSGDLAWARCSNQQVPARFQKVPRLLHFWGNGVWPRRGVQKGTGSEQVPVGSEQVPVCLAHARCRFLQSANRLRRPVRVRSKVLAKLQPRNTMIYMGQAREGPKAWQKGRGQPEAPNRQKLITS